MIEMIYELNKIECNIFLWMSDCFWKKVILFDNKIFLFI